MITFQTIIYSFDKDSGVPGNFDKVVYKLKNRVFNLEMSYDSNVFVFYANIQLEMI